MAKDQYQPSKVHLWNRLVCDAIHYVGMPPTIAARALAMVHTAMYDAWTNYNIGGCEVSTTTGNRFQQPDYMCTVENRERAYSHAAFTIAQDLFWLQLPPEKKNMFRDFMCECGFDADDKNLEPEDAAGLGNLCGQLVLQCRAGDRANQYATLDEGAYGDFTNYSPKNPPVPQPLKYEDRWQPQLKDTHNPQDCMTAHWGLVKPFALSWGGQFRPVEPASCEDREYGRQAETVLEFSANLTDEQKIMAELWAGMHEDKFVDTPKDGKPRNATPPEQCCRIARFLSRKSEYKNGFDIKMFFAITNALLDAGIAAWDCKMHYDYVRPISAIQDLYRGKTVEAWGGPCEGTKEIEGENWVPYIPTPPFPEYVSGHSTFSAAFEEVISRFRDCGMYGESIVIPKGTSKIEPNCTPEDDIHLHWETVKQSSDEAGISRLYGGIHFKSGDLEGRKLGCRVGQEVWDKVCEYFNGELG